MTGRERNRQTHFYDTGYLKVEGVLTSDEVGNAKGWVWELAERKYGEDISGLESEATQDRVGRVKMYHIVEQDERFMDIAAHPKLIQELEPLLGPNIEFILNRHNHATLNYRGDNPIRLHRDILQPTRDIVTAIVYLDGATAENGATRIIPGSQKFPHVPATDHGGTWIDEYPEMFGGLEDQALPVAMSEGGVLIFNSLTFHTAGENHTDKSRMSLAFAYRSVDELCRIPDNNTRLIAGERIFRGNVFDGRM